MSNGKKRTLGRHGGEGAAAARCHTDDDCDVESRAFHPSPLDAPRRPTIRRGRGGRGGRTVTRGSQVDRRRVQPEGSSTNVVEADAREVEEDTSPEKRNGKKPRARNPVDTSAKKRPRCDAGPSYERVTSNSTESPEANRRPPLSLKDIDGTQERRASVVNRIPEVEHEVEQDRRVMDVLGDQAVRIEKLEQAICRSTSVIEKLDEKLSSIAELIKSAPGGRLAPKLERVNRYNSIEKYKEIMLEDLKLLPIHVSKQSFSWAISRCLVRQILGKFVRGEHFNVQVLEELFNIMFFSIKPVDSRTALKSAAAKEGFKFRRTIVLECVSLSEKNFLGLYSDDTTDDKRPPRPFWLKMKEGGQVEGGSKQYVLSSRSLNLGIDRHEFVGAAAKDGSRRNYIAAMKVEPTMEDYGEFIGYYAFSQLTSMFNSQRRSVSHTFGESLGYIFCDWGEEWATKGVSKDSLCVSWSCEDGDRLKKTSDIPRASEVCKVCKTDGRSARKFVDLVNELESLQIVIQHDVVVNNKRRNRVRNGHEAGGGRQDIRLLRRVISLMDVALSIIYSISGHNAATDAKNLLDLHRQTIIAVYLLAVGLRDFLENQDMIEVQSSNDRRPPDSEKLNHCKEIWNVIKPNLQVRERFLKRVLQVSESDFKDTHVKEPGDGDSSADDAEDSAAAGEDRDGGRHGIHSSGELPEVFTLEEDDSALNAQGSIEQDEGEIDRDANDDVEAAAGNEGSQSGSLTVSQSLDPSRGR